MISSVISYCGSGGNGVFPSGGLSDLNTFQESVIPYQLSFMHTSGVLVAYVDIDGNCYFATLGKSVFLKSSVIDVACGWTHVLLLCNDGVYSYGKGSQGQIGLGDIKDVNEPVFLNISTAIAVAAGFRTSFVISRLGVFVFGENQKYQLGLGHKNLVKVPVINEDLGEITKIAAGNKHALGFCRDSLFVWGSNQFGQLGIDAAESQTPTKVFFCDGISDVASGWNHSVLLLHSGKVLTSGKGDLGQQGIGVYSNQNKFSCVLENIQKISSGSEHIFAISNKKEIYSWGWNEHGNLGTGDNENRPFPTLLIKQASHIYLGGAVTFLI